MSELIPNKNIQKILISTPTKFLGKYESDLVTINHAFHADFRRMGLDFGIQNEYSRFYFVLAFRTEEKGKKTPIIPQYDWIGDMICILLSVFFGKRFDNLGPLQMSGFYRLPNIEKNTPIVNNRRYFNNWEKRKDGGYDLNLTEIGRINKLIWAQIDNENFDYYLTAAKQYWRSIQIFDDDPEIAFLHLVECGEILSNSAEFKFSDSELYEEEDIEMFHAIEKGIEDGEKYVRIIKDKYFHIKKKYTRAIIALLGEAFEKRQLINRNNLTFEQRIRASYDLRSKYVHTGCRFRDYITFPSDVQYGNPNTGYGELDKYLYKSPTYVGLERIIRFALLRFCHLYVLPFDNRLDEQ